MDGIVGFVLAGIALAGSPGPATLSLAAAGAAFGARQGIGYLAGLVAGMILVMAVIASGLAGLALALPGVAPVVAAASACYFLYLAWRIATAAPVTEASAQQCRPNFLAGLLLSLVNPKGYAAMAALFSGFVLIGARFDLDALAKIGVLTMVIITVNIAWLSAGAMLTRFFRDPRTSRILNVSFAVLLIVSIFVALAL